MSRPMMGHTSGTRIEALEMAIVVLRWTRLQLEMMIQAPRRSHTPADPSSILPLWGRRSAVVSFALLIRHGDVIRLLRLLSFYRSPILFFPKAPHSSCDSGVLATNLCGVCIISIAKSSPGYNTISTPSSFYPKLEKGTYKDVHILQQRMLPHRSPRLTHPL